MQDLALNGLRLIEYELTLFAAFWFVIGIADELAVDLVYGWLRFFRRHRTHQLKGDISARPLQGIAAVLIPTWQEVAVIGATITHALKVWPQHDLRLYIGCYVNDPATLVAAMAAAGSDVRVRIVIHEKQGPTTKADCLNRLYRALRDDEARSGVNVRMIVLHDAEDMVHPAALALMDTAITDADFVQIPVRPERQANSRWIAGHYVDEFTESHAKAMVVRDALGAGLPAAGVGCAFSRGVIGDMARRNLQDGLDGPFEAECLTEDYELGLMVARSGKHSRFIRLRDHDGSLIATRSYFPGSLAEAVRQKTRWVHGIAFQGWERMGWWGKPVDVWMAMRDRRGPLVALILAVAYFLIVLTPMMAIADRFGQTAVPAESPLFKPMMVICLLGLVWRAAMRFVFTAREYGAAEGLRAVLRIPIANIIAIIAGRRAFIAYLRSFFGHAPVWDKTEHKAHPALVLAGGELR
ncbi:MAG: glycosyl transferase family protein [Novosphingobium sp.]